MIARVMNKTTVVAYVLRDRNNGEYITLDKNTVDNLALNKEIYNCYAQVYQGSCNLKGINCQISKLPKFRPDGSPTWMLEDRIKV